MKKTITIAHPEQVKLACEIIQGLPLSPVHEVVIREHKKDRSLAQNALMWSWLTKLASEYGDSKDDRHTYYKGKFLVSIFERDDEDYAAMIASIRLIKKDGMLREYQCIKDEVIRLTSTTDASVKQMSEYLGNISHHAASIGVGFVQDELYHEAMGKRK